MKKLTSIILILAILSSCFTFVGCSDNSELTMKENYLKQFRIADKNANEVVIDYDGGTYRGARVVMLDAEWHDVEEREEKIFDININYYDKNSLYAYKFGIFFSIPIARLLGILTDDEIREITEKFNSEVRHFRDTCDIFDFPPYQPMGEYGDGKIVPDMIAVTIDNRVLISRDFPPKAPFDIIDYLGEDIIESQKEVLWASDKSTSFALVVCEQWRNNIPEVIERISKIPGVLASGYYYRMHSLHQ